MALEDLEDLLDSLKSGFEGLTSPVADLKSALAGLTSQQDAANNGLKQGRDELGRFTSAGGGAQSLMGRAFEGIAGGANKVAASIHSLGAGAMSVLTGQIPSTTQAASQLGQALDAGITGATNKAGEALSKLGPEGAAAGAAIEALGAVAGATVGQLTALAGVALEVNERLTLMTDRFAAFSGGAAAGKALQASLEGLNLPFAKSQVEAWALALEKAGVSADKVADRVKAVAAAEALGEGGGGAATSIFKKLGDGGPAADKFIKDIAAGSRHAWADLHNMGIQMSDLGGKAAVAKMSAEQLSEAISKAMQEKGKNPLADMGNSLPVILTKAQEGLRSLFDGLDIKPFMAEVKSFFGEFSKGGVVINTLKPIVTAVFGLLFSWATMAFHAIHVGLLQLVIYALQGYIALRPMITSFMDLAKSGETTRGLGDALKMVGTIVLIVAGVVAAMVAEWVQTTIEVFAVIGALDQLGDSISEAVGQGLAALSGLASGAVDAASNFISGLVQGIVAGAGAVVDAVKGLASSALGAFTGAFGIRSPSKVMLEHGEENIGGAAATGVDRAQPRMKASMARLSDGAGKGGKRGGMSSDDGGRSVTFNNCTFWGTTEEKIRALWWRFLEETAGEAGAAGAAPGQG